MHSLDELEPIRKRMTGSRVQRVRAPSITLSNAPAQHVDEFSILRGIVWQAGARTDISFAVFRQFCRGEHAFYL